MSASVLEGTQRVPTHCSSPGWKETPQDTTTVVGSYVHFNCRSSLSHKATVWLLDGREIKGTSPLADRIKIYNRNASLKFGPVKASDNGLVFGCKVTTSYGPLPSKTGRITVMSKLQ